jgi:hypothetical protein
LNIVQAEVGRGLAFLICQEQVEELQRIAVGSHGMRACASPEEDSELDASPLTQPCASLRLDKIARQKWIGANNTIPPYGLSKVQRSVKQDPMFNKHRAFEASGRVLEEMLAKGELGDDVSRVVTEALRRELVLQDVRGKADKLRESESHEDFPEVAGLYKVIDSDTRTVVVDPELINRLANSQEGFVAGTGPRKRSDMGEEGARARDSPL